jgi:flagellar assembly protein FliH
MSSSASLAPAALPALASPAELAAKVAAKAAADDAAMPFPFAEAQLHPGQRNFPLVEASAFAFAATTEEEKPAMPNPTAAAAEVSAAMLAEREAQAREAGRQQALAESRAKFEEGLGVERAAIAKAVEDFSRERRAYYKKIEEETVRLALAIARKVIHREAQVDPFLLMGMVRVALERMEGATGVVLQVHPERVAEWRKYLAAKMDAGKMPEIMEDTALARERCVLKTAMGTAELGLEPQLLEIEKGLMDLLAARPA